MSNRFSLQRHRAAQDNCCRAAIGLAKKKKYGHSGEKALFPYDPLLHSVHPS
jgi:hypothetical protein